MSGIGRTRLPCPVEGCPRERQGEMCGTHWRRVSQPTQEAVWATWKAFRNAMTDPAKSQAYRQARDDARAEASS